MLKSDRNSDRSNQQASRFRLPAKDRTRLDRNDARDLFERCSNRRDWSVAVIHLRRQRYLPHWIASRVVLAVFGYRGQVRQAQQKQNNGQLVYEAKQRATLCGRNRPRPITPRFKPLSIQMH
jgi:hypothetical protein